MPHGGDFFRISLDPRVGREQSGERPGLVLSGRGFNELTGYVFVAPVTSTRRDWPFEVPVPPGGKVSRLILADQTKSTDHVARYVCYIEPAPAGLAEATLERLAAILEI